MTADVRGSCAAVASRQGVRSSWILPLLGSLVLLCGLDRAAASDDTDEALNQWTAQFGREVDRLLDVPPADQQRYLTMLQETLTAAQVTDSAAQTFVLVDRSPQVQAIFVVVRRPGGGWHWIGATPVSTGKIGKFQHFVTPLGVFPHTLDNPDFRSKGTVNENGIRGYGVKGRRVFDFGWQLAERGWDAEGFSKMRLQMHATDPRGLEPRLGTVASEGCVRIPATLNVFLDVHGILDADYETARAGGEVLWVLGRGRQVIPWPGRYLVIVDSQSTDRPAWSPMPVPKASPVRSPPVSGKSFGGQGFYFTLPRASLDSVSRGTQAPSSAGNRSNSDCRALFDVVQRLADRGKYQLIRRAFVDLRHIPGEDRPELFDELPHVSRQLRPVRVHLHLLDPRHVLSSDLVPGPAPGPRAHPIRHTAGWSVRYCTQGRGDEDRYPT